MQLQDERWPYNFGSRPKYPRFGENRVAVFGEVWGDHKSAKANVLSVFYLHWDMKSKNLSYLILHLMHLYRKLELEFSP